MCILSNNAGTYDDMHSETKDVNQQRFCYTVPGYFNTSGKPQQAKLQINELDYFMAILNLQDFCIDMMKYFDLFSSLDYHKQTCSLVEFTCLVLFNSWMPMGS